MQNNPYKNNATELSIILPLLGEGMYLEGMLKLLTLDIAVSHEVIFMCEYEMFSQLTEHMCSKYKFAKWLERQAKESTLNALKRGIEAAAGQYILMVSADTIGPDIPIHQMLSLANQGCDFVNSSRYAAYGKRLGGSFFESTLSKLANCLLYSLGGSAFTDSTTRLKLFRKSIFSQLSLESKSPGWAVSFESALKAQYAGLKIGEVPTVAVDRFYGGKSTFRLSTELIEYLKWFVWGICKTRGTKANLISTPIR